MEKMVKFSILTCSFLLMAGCSKPNPILNNEVIDNLKHLSVADSTDFPYTICVRYYADAMKDKSQERTCLEWSKQAYIMEKNSGNIPSNATLADFRDSQVWQKVQPLTKAP